MDILHVCSAVVMTLLAPRLIRHIICANRSRYFSITAQKISSKKSSDEKYMYVTSGNTPPTLPDEKEFRSPPALPSLYMDTHQLVKDLILAGYGQPQAEAVVTLVKKSLQNSILSVTTECVKRHELDLLSLRLRGDVESIKSNMVLIEKSVVDSLRKDNEALKGQIEKLMAGFKEEVAKVQSGLSLDLNLEKSRIKEEATGLQQLVKDTNNTIEKEVAKLKTQIESQKLESIKYLAGGIFSMVTIILSVVLGIWRLLGK